jgi:septum site-determining protein MinC
MGLPVNTPAVQKLTPAGRAKARLKGLLEHERVEVLEQERLYPHSSTERFSVSVRGKSDGLVLRIGDEAAWDVVLRDLVAQFNQVNSRAFFQGAMLHLDATGRKITPEEIEELTRTLGQFGVTLASVIDNSTVMQAYLGIRETIPPVRPEQSQLQSLATWRTRSVPPQGLSAVFVRQPLRSGEVFRHTETLVILGNVPNAAEVITNGDIFVFGRLRGVAHAGASGNENAIIGALLLTPTQLRISHHVLSRPNSLGSGVNIGEIARVHDGQILIEPWLK